MGKQSDGEARDKREARERIKLHYRMIYGAELDEELDQRIKELEGLEDIGITTKRIGPAPRLPKAPLHWAVLPNL